MTRATQSRKKGKDARVEEKLREVRTLYPEELDGFTRAMVDDMAKCYCWYCVTCDMLQEQIDAEGMVVEGMHGGKENPAMGALHKASGRQHEYFSKIMTVLRRAAPKQETDDLDEWLSGDAQ